MGGQDRLGVGGKKSTRILGVFLVGLASQPFKIPARQKRTSERQLTEAAAILLANAIAPVGASSEWPSVAF